MERSNLVVRCPREWPERASTVDDERGSCRRGAQTIRGQEKSGRHEVFERRPPVAEDDLRRRARTAAPVHVSRAAPKSSSSGGMLISAP
jgi:hypothetical protein